jgi:hypothetical protein
MTMPEILVCLRPGPRPDGGGTVASPADLLAWRERVMGMDALEQIENAFPES